MSLADAIKDSFNDGQSPTKLSPLEEMIRWPLACWTVGVLTSIHHSDGQVTIFWAEWNLTKPFPSGHMNWHAYCDTDQWDGHAVVRGSTVVCGNGSLWIWHEDGSIPGAWLHFLRHGNFKFRRGVRE